MYVNKRALVPVPQFAVCLEASDVSQSIAARATERKTSEATFCSPQSFTWS